MEPRRRSIPDSTTARIAFVVPFHDNFGDRYTVLVSAITIGKRASRPSSFTEVTAARSTSCSFRSRRRSNSRRGRICQVPSRGRWVPVLTRQKPRHGTEVWWLSGPDQSPHC